MKPIFPKHPDTCRDCVFLGTYLDKEDLYYCPQSCVRMPTVIAIWGEEGSEYRSGMHFAEPDIDPSLYEAKQRATARGLL